MVQENRLDYETENKKRLIIITGPTASGKSNAAIKMAKKYNGEIISCDSVQVYKHLDIGSNKIKKEEMQGIPHHLIDIKELDEDYTAYDFTQDAEKLINKISSRGKVPIICGGTLMYITSLMFRYDFYNVANVKDLRKKWNDIAQEKGNDFVHSYIEKIDKASAEQIAVNDLKRMIRFIEVWETTGQLPYKGWYKPKYKYKFFVMNPDRNELYARINTRVDRMFYDGLVDEVRGLLKYRYCKSLTNAIGYKELLEYFDGNYSLEMTKAMIKQHTRNYAKRQLTYVRNINLMAEFINDDILERILKIN